LLKTALTTILPTSNVLNLPLSWSLPYGIRGKRRFRGSYSDTYTGSVAQDWAIVISAFKPGTGSASSTNVYYIHDDALGGTSVVSNASGTGKTVPPATHHLKERLRRDIQPSDDSIKRFLQLLAVLCSEPQNAAGNDGIYYFVKFL
jgi:hypothetical protein